MDEETKKELKKMSVMIEENNNLLLKMQRATRWARFFRIFYWLVIFGSMLGAYYTIQPYIDMVREQIPALKGGFDTLQKITPAFK